MKFWVQYHYLGLKIWAKILVHLGLSLYICWVPMTGKNHERSINAQVFTMSLFVASPNAWSFAHMNHKIKWTVKGRAKSKYCHFPNIQPTVLKVLTLWSIIQCQFLKFVTIEFSRQWIFKVISLYCLLYTCVCFLLARRRIHPEFTEKIFSSSYISALALVVIF